MPRIDRVSQQEYMREWYARTPAAKDKALARKARYQERNRKLVARLLARRCPGCGNGDELHREYRVQELLRLARVPCSVARLRAAARTCEDPKVAVAQRTEHPVPDRAVGGSTPSGDA